MAKADDPKFALAFARIENHYFVNGGFFEYDGQLIAEAGKLASIPHITIVQGRYDLVCPFKTAYQLKKQLPHADFRVIPDAGHSASEPGIESELVKAMDQLKDKLKK